VNAVLLQLIQTRRVSRKRGSSSSLTNSIKTRDDWPEDTIKSLKVIQ